LLALFAALLLLSVGPGATAGTSTPPHNGLIAVEGTVEGRDGIYIVDPRTGTARLIPKSSELGDPAWSPDGTLLAVTSFDGEALAFDVYTMKPDGTERTLVLRNASYPSWSPNAKQLVVMRDTEGEGSSLAIVNADGTDVRTLGPFGTQEAPNEALNVVEPEWSPDGKSIAFIHEGGRINLISPDGKRPSSVSWSPDSSKLAFDRYDLNIRETVVVLDLASGHETVRRGEENGAAAPVWSPDGNQLVFSSLDVRSAVAQGSCCAPLTPHLWGMAPDGAKAHKLVEGEFYGTPSWGRAAETVAVLPSDAR
jgi:Tol biopolymer transport system component